MMCMSVKCTEAWTRKLMAREDITMSRWLVRGRRVSKEVASKLSLQGKKVLCLPELIGGGCGLSKVSCEVRLRNTHFMNNKEISCYHAFAEARV
jgi:hypothetical protein